MLPQARKAAGADGQVDDVGQGGCYEVCSQLYSSGINEVSACSCRVLKTLHDLLVPVDSHLPRHVYGSWYSLFLNV